LFSVPASLLKLATTMLGWRNEKSPFFDFLKVDCGRTREEVFDWTPRVGVDVGLQQTARSFQQAELALDPIARSA
jgi:hypothetical protein